MSNAGCAKINKRAIDASTTEISCCCNHLTMLTSYITIVEDPTDPTQNLDISCSEIYDRDTQSKSVNQEQTQWIPAALDICECPVNKKMIGAFKCGTSAPSLFCPLASRAPALAYSWCPPATSPVFGEGSQILKPNSNLLFKQMTTLTPSSC